MNLRKSARDPFVCTPPPQAKRIRFVVVENQGTETRKSTGDRKQASADQNGTPTKTARGGGKWTRKKEVTPEEKKEVKPEEKKDPKKKTDCKTVKADHVYVHDDGEGKEEKIPQPEKTSDPGIAEKTSDPGIVCDILSVKALVVIDEAMSVQWSQAFAVHRQIFLEHYVANATSVGNRTVRYAGRISVIVVVDSATCSVIQSVAIPWAPRYMPKLKLTETRTDLEANVDVYDVDIFVGPFPSTEFASVIDLACQHRRFHALNQGWGHSNTAFVFHDPKTIEVFEPKGSRQDPTVANVLGTYLLAMPRHHGYRCAPPMPTDGPQWVSRDDFCSNWCLLHAMLRLDAKTRFGSDREVHDYLVNHTQEWLRTLMRQWIRFVWTYADRHKLIGVSLSDALQHDARRASALEEKYKLSPASECRGFV